MSDDTDRDEVPPATVPESIPEEQADDDPRGEDEIRRELGPGDGDDAPPVTGDEPSPR